MQTTDAPDFMGALLRVSMSRPQGRASARSKGHKGKPLPVPYQLVPRPDLMSYPGIMRAGRLCLTLCSPA
jgi:hypothetical protein